MRVNKSTYNLLSKRNREEFTLLSQQSKIRVFSTYMDQSDQILNYLNGLPERTLLNGELVLKELARIDVAIDGMNQAILPIMSSEQRSLISLSFDQIEELSTIGGVTYTPDGEVIDRTQQGLLKPFSFSDFNVAFSIWSDQKRAELYSKIQQEALSGKSRSEVLNTVDEFLKKGGQGGQFYKTERIVDTEFQRAYSRGLVDSTRDLQEQSGERMVYRRRLSLLHKVTDVCDELAGNYDARKQVPEVPSHPYCSCEIQRMFIADMSGNWKYKKLKSSDGVYTSKQYGTEVMFY